ncbi:MAG: ParB/RepB/Spo0J family partition protein [Myxococcota bacterium]
MSARRNALGRGIGALIPPAQTRTATAAASGPVGETTGELPVDAIDPNPDQPRRRFETVELDRLADSIRQHGVLQPVVVRRAGDRYELIVGERRWRASRVAGRDTIPAVVADRDGGDRLELALVENVQRHDLNPMELAHAFRGLSDRGLTQEEIGRRVSLDRSTVANHLRLLELPRELQEDVESRRITAGHAKALLQVANPERRRHLRDRLLRENLSVRAVEQLGRAIAGPAAKRRPRTPTAVDPNIQRVIDRLRQRFQTRVKLQGDASRGRIEIEYFGDDDLQRITGILLGDA